MNVATLGRLIHRAIFEKPPAELAEYCGEYYEAYYHLLYLLAIHSRGVCVELGVERGRGLLAMALSGRECWGVDNNMRPETRRLASERPNMHLVEAPSLPPPEPVREAAGGRIGLLHIDTEHSFAQAREEFNAWLPFLQPGAVVCFDDTHAAGDEVGRFVLTTRRPQLHDDRLHSCGYAVVLMEEQ